jgi:hypothetical protein
MPEHVRWLVSHGRLSADVLNGVAVGTACVTVLDGESASSPAATKAVARIREILNRVEVHRE